MPCGWGKYVYDDGRVYQGKLAGGKREGQGFMQSSEGRAVEGGVWEGDVLTRRQPLMEVETDVGMSVDNAVEYARKERANAMQVVAKLQAAGHAKQCLHVEDSGGPALSAHSAQLLKFLPRADHITDMVKTYDAVTMR